MQPHVGTLFLDRLDGPGSVASGRALWVAGLALAGAAVLGAVLGPRAGTAARASAGASAGPGRRTGPADGDGPA
ncbi:hypothetical protein [Streptomyces niveus]